MTPPAVQRDVPHPLRRFALAAGPPLAGAAFLVVVTGLLFLEGVCAFGECGPNLLAWSLPVLVCWIAGSATWISGVRRRVTARMRGGLAMLALVPTGGWVILQAVAWG